MSKVMSMKEAIKRFIKNGMTIYISGFTHLIGYAAAHEIIRQEVKDLTICRPTPELLVDEMVAAGCVKKTVFSWAGNPGVGSLRSIRRAVEKGIPHKIEVEEYDHFSFAARVYAGAMGIPFMPIRNLFGSDLSKYNKKIKFIECPYTRQKICVVPALNPDVAIIHVQRADEEGNAQVWGITGLTKHIAFASSKVIITCEEIVESEIIKRDPNRTLIPGFKVDAVVEEPFAAHPSYAQGYYYRDNDYYRMYDEISKDEKKLEEFLEEWIYSVENRQEYIKKLGVEKLLKLLVKPYYSYPVNFGRIGR